MAAFFTTFDHCVESLDLSVCTEEGPNQGPKRLLYYFNLFIIAILVLLLSPDHRCKLALILPLSIYLLRVLSLILNITLELTSLTLDFFLINL